MAVVDIFRCKHGDAAVPMLGVIPIKERTTEGSAVFLRAESFREFWSVLHGLEMTLRIGVIVGNVRSAMTLGGAQICQELSNTFGCHRRPAIRMDDQLARFDLLFLAGIGNEAFGKSGRFPARQQPSGDITAVDIEDDVQVVVGPFDRTFEFGDVP